MHRQSAARCGPACGRRRLWAKTARRWGAGGSPSPYVASAAWLSTSAPSCLQQSAQSKVHFAAKSDSMHVHLHAISCYAHIMLCLCW
jgi:hypothetical protein